MIVALKLRLFVWVDLVL